jgi:hypothetical protein
MNFIAGLVNAVLSRMVHNRDRLPWFVNRLIDNVAKRPDGVAARIAATLLGGARSSSAPPPTASPAKDVRIYIGPTNYAGQGYRWARALEANSDRIGARNMAVELPGGFSFPADTLVPVAVYNRNTAWQKAELAAVKRFTHVLFEAERPLFGSLLSRDVAREIAVLREAGVSCAFLCHGTDVRSPELHLRDNPWSPFADDATQARQLQAEVDANLALLRATDLPIFVSTPDLLQDVPNAAWCPVVIDPTVWNAEQDILARSVPVVTHIPSMSSAKGTKLIEPTLLALHNAGTIEYRSPRGVPSRDMPPLIADSDIILDQFRLGSYGVAACEAMAAGRVVIGHVSAPVRDKVHELTGHPLPIVEADPDTLATVIAEVISDRAGARRTAAHGQNFVHTWHSGPASARALREHWIDR